MLLKQKNILTTQFITKDEKDQNYAIITYTSSQQNTCWLTSQ